MKKILFLFAMTLFVSVGYSQSKEIKTVYTMNKNDRGGGFENIIFNVTQSSISKKDKYYNSYQSFLVELKSHSYNEENEFVEVYQTPIDLDNIKNTPVGGFNIFYIFYTKKGGEILGISQTSQKGQKMYFTQYGFERQRNLTNGSKNETSDIVEEISNIDNIKTFNKWIESQDNIIFVKRTNNQNGFTKLYDINSFNSSVEKHLIVAFNLYSEPTKVIFISYPYDKSKIVSKLKSRGFINRDENSRSYFANISEQIFVTLELNENNVLIVQVVNDMENM